MSIVSLWADETGSTTGSTVISDYTKFDFVLLAIYKYYKDSKVFSLVPVQCMPTNNRIRVCAQTDWTIDFKFKTNTSVSWTGNYAYACNIWGIKLT